MNRGHWLLAAVLVSGCAGGGMSASTSGAPPQGPSGMGTAQFTIVVPAKVPSSADRSLKYISPSTKSVTIAVNNTGSPQIVNVTPGSPGCTTTSSGTTCSVGVSAPSGNDTFTVTMYDQQNGTGNVLGTGNVTAAVNAGQSFNVNITPGGTVAKLFISLAPTSGSNTVAVSAVAQDAGGNTIVGPFSSPVNVTSSGGSVTFTGTSLASSSSTVNASGTGNATITLSSGSLSASGQVPLTSATSYPIPIASPAPFVMALGPDGNFWFDEVGPCQLPVLIATNFCVGSTGRIARVTPAGAFTDFALPNNLADPIGMVAGPDGNMWFSEFFINKVAKMSTSGQLTEYPLPAATPNPNSGLSTRGPRTPTVGPDGNIWFVETFGRMIGSINTSGTSIQEFPIPAIKGVNTGPSSIATGPDGRLWFTQANGNMIGAMTTSGAVTEYTVPTAGAFPRFIVQGSDGAMWFSELGGNVNAAGTPPTTGIGRITTSGSMTEYRLPGAGNLDSIDSLALGPDGNVWFVDFVGALGRISPSGQFALYPIPPATGSAPNGLAFAPDGSLWWDDQGGTYGRLSLGTGWMPLPSAVQVPGIGTGLSQLITIAESGNSGPFTVTSANTSVASVAAVNGLTSAYFVTGVAIGKTSISITDSKGRLHIVPVDVNAASVTLKSRQREIQ